MVSKIKGTKDYSPSLANCKEVIKKQFYKQIKNFCFNIIETPIMEPVELYRRSVSESDIVKKEMYEFKDKGKRDIALRPEGTAGFIRALIENKWYVPNDEIKSTKFAYFGPMFRYEQPQKGRLRQFYQAGVETIMPKDQDLNPYQDAELIIMAWNILKSLNIDFVLKINSIGDSNSRILYQDNLKKYLQDYKNELTETSQERLNNNVLRILDDKIDSQKDFVKNAPKIDSFLSEKSKEYFDKLLYILDKNAIKYQKDSSLVRGLDYYDEVVYEFVSLSQNAGSQSTVIGGGRYSNLVKDLNGPDLYASGWGMGVDRLIDLMLDDKNHLFKDINNKIDVLIGASNINNLDKLFSLCILLRNYIPNIEFISTPFKSKKLFEKAKKYNSTFLVCDDEKEGDNCFIIKNLLTNEKWIYKFSLLMDNKDEIITKFLKNNFPIHL
ncbi:histidine--tRNA ligase [Mycoplasma tauri]|uniref:histidine--tRNA ligase n=1 Tax=Mycoplasma tauri TaxID=547987 RepID=UPI001CBC1EB5|nr:histidine--tRNA ligase [Mycoplasma tauri]MBZ4218416.1 histidine--tRNA ligase [Mycoplasma tauri]